MLNSVSFQSIKKEIERRLDCIQRIAYEPQLIWDDDSRYILKPDATLPPFYYRFKAVDDIKILGFLRYTDISASNMLTFCRDFRKGNFKARWISPNASR